ADIVYLLQGELAEEVRRTPGLTLRPTPIVSTHWLVFLDQWDPKSPWADRRVRLAANHAINRPAINEAITLGFSRITWSIIPQSFDFFWQPPAYAYDPAKAKQLLSEAGYPKGFDAGDLWCDAATATMSEATAGYLQAVGIRARVRPLERAGFFKAYQEKKLKNLVYSISGAFGNAAIRLETFVAAGGPYVYGSYPDIDGLFREQAGELDRKRREAMLHRIQQLVYDKAIYAPIWELGFVHASGSGAGRTNRRRSCALRRRRSAPQDPGGDAARARQADRHGAARPHDVVEPRADDRHAGERSGAAPSEAARRFAPRTRAAGAPTSPD